MTPDTMTYVNHEIETIVLLDGPYCGLFNVIGEAAPDECVHGQRYVRTPQALDEHGYPCYVHAGEWVWNSGKEATPVKRRELGVMPWDQKAS